jgi:hypothetical protein
MAPLLSIVGAPEPSGPWPFSAKAADLKRQYYIREVSPPTEQHEAICLEAYPRTAAVAGWCQKLQLLFRAGDMSPIAMKIVQPNGKDAVVYQFFDVAANAPPPHDDPFHPAVPLGWQKIVEGPLAPR